MFQIDVNAVNDRNPYMWKKKNGNSANRGKTRKNSQIIQINLVGIHLKITAMISVVC